MGGPSLRTRSIGLGCGQPRFGPGATDRSPEQRTWWPGWTSCGLSTGCRSSSRPTDPRPASGPSAATRLLRSVRERAAPRLAAHGYCELDEYLGRCGEPMVDLTAVTEAGRDQQIRHEERRIRELHATVDRYATTIFVLRRQLDALPDPGTTLAPFAPPRGSARIRRRSGG